MNLTFSRQFSYQGQIIETNFESKIKKGTKIHAFRLGHKKKVGQHIHFWSGSPRVPQMNPYQFKIPIDMATRWSNWKHPKSKQLYLLPEIVGIEKWEMKFTDGEQRGDYKLDFKIGGLFFNTPEMIELVALADGFDKVEHFLHWFDTVRKAQKTDTINGQLIHWTDTNFYSNEFQI